MHRALLVACCSTLAIGCGDRASAFALGDRPTSDSRRDSVEAAHAALLAESMAVMEFVGELNSELARAGRLRLELSMSAAGESKIAEAKREREALALRVREILLHLDSTEARLAQAEQRAARMAGRESALSARVAQLMLKVDSLRQAASAEQRALASRIATLEGAVVMLAGDTARLAARVSELTSSANTAFYVAATESELIERGIIVREGARRYLLAGPRPVHSARNLPVDAFVPIDISTAHTIALPPGRYRIVSRHSLDFVDHRTIDDGKVAGALRITSPERFWAGSRYLILVRS